MPIRAIEGKPVRKEEWMAAHRNCRVGDTLKAFNHWRADLREQYTKAGYGKWEKSKIKKKFPFLVLLENGRTVDYAEVALQRR